MDTSGRVVIPAKFSRVRNYSEGLAAVEVNQKWGYINKTGRFVIRPRFDSVMDFHEGLAVMGSRHKNALAHGMAAAGRLIKGDYKGYMDTIRQGPYDWTWGCIDKSGNIVIPPAFTELHDFSDGLAEATVMRGERRFCTFVDSTGAQAFLSTFDRTYPFRDGLALVERGGYWGYIDKAGSFVVPLHYTEAYPFNEGLAAVMVDDKWGFIDTTGRTRIEPRFDDGGYFHEGLCPVVVNYKTGFIDTSGRIVIRPQFFHVGPGFHYGLEPASINDHWRDKWGFIDRDGKFVIPPNFFKVGFFTDGLAPAELTSTGVGFINTAGRYVIKSQPMYVTGFHEELAAFWLEKRGPAGFSATASVTLFVSVVVVLLVWAVVFLLFRRMRRQAG
jgi:hypothetical protein